MGLADELVRHRVLLVLQEAELLELIGFETRNKYRVTNEGGGLLAYAAEQGQGFVGGLGRIFLGHWRSFDIHVFDPDRKKFLVVHHPFRWIFQRLQISNAQGRPMGAIEANFSLLGKRFDIEDATGAVRMSVSSPWWRIWTFPFMKGDRQVAVVSKKWGGILAESLTDTDRFRIEFEDSRLTGEERLLILAAALFIDLQYFENRAD